MKIKFTQKQFIDALLHSPKFNEKDFILLCMFLHRSNHTITIGDLKNVFNNEVDLLLRKRIGSIGSKILKYHKIDLHKEISLYKFSYYNVFCNKLNAGKNEESWQLCPEMISALSELCKSLDNRNNHQNPLMQKAYDRLYSIISKKAS